MVLRRKVAFALAAILVTLSGWTVAKAAAHAANVLAASTCSAALIQVAPWNAVCYPSRVPRWLLHTAPFTLVDPSRIVSSTTGLALTGVYAARLGSDDPNAGRPLGPLMMVDYVFGTLPARSADHNPTGRYVSVWEDGYFLQRGGLSSGGGVYNGQAVFGRRRLEMAVTTDGPRSWVTTLTREIRRVIISHPARPAPRLRLYVHAPGSQLIVGKSVSFFVLNNVDAAQNPAAFELVMHGGWQSPQVFSPYEGQACGGDNIPRISRSGRARWALNFGDCREVSIVLTPTQPGPHSIEIRTYRLEVDASGTPIPGRRHFVPNGGFSWTGTAS